MYLFYFGEILKTYLRSCGIIRYRIVRIDDKVDFDQELHFGL